jgi:hypothetical protein
MTVRRPAIVALAASTVALGSSGAIAAEDWAAVVGGGADERLAKRLEERVRTIPGTDTRFLIGGFVEIDGVATRRLQAGTEQATFLVSSTPFGPADDDRRLSIRQSQINWLSSTPTAFGPLTLNAQANLFSLDLDGTTTLSLQRLYGRLANVLVAGRTYSTFVDPDVLPTTLDYNGPSGLTSVQQWLVRGVLPFGSGWTLAAGVEQAQADHRAELRSVELRSEAQRPDIAARLRFDFERGHLQVSGVSRRIEVTATARAATTSRTFDASGLSISGSLATIGDDSLVAQYTTGKGVGRYFNDSISGTGVGVGIDDRLQLIRSSGATLYYQHHWNPDWMSVAGASTLWGSDAGTRLPDALRRLVYASANVVHRLLPTLLVGAEGLWGRATRADGISSTNARLQVSVRYLVE